MAIIPVEMKDNKVIAYNLFRDSIVIKIPSLIKLSRKEIKNVGLIPIRKNVITKMSPFFRMFSRGFHHYKNVNAVFFFFFNGKQCRTRSLK